MQITEFMLDAAIRKATEAGLFSRHGSFREIAINREIMRLILQAVARAEEVESAEESALGCAGRAVNESRSIRAG